MQEKIVPLIKVIKTKEPAVMIAALRVLRAVGQVADAEFVAMDILPVLWHMSLGPLLDLKQFRSFMDLIKSLSARVEEEQTRKLQELSGNSNGSAALPNEDFMSFGGAPSASALDTNGSTEDDFERLVKGRDAGAGAGAGAGAANPMDSGWDSMAPPSAVTSPGLRSSTSAAAPAFSWSTPSPTMATPHASQSAAQQAPQPPGFRTVTPDLGQFATLTPSSTQFSRPLQPATSAQQPATTTTATPAATSSITWGAAATGQANPWASSASTASTPAGGPQAATASLAGGSFAHRPNTSQSRGSSFSLPPPPTSNTPPAAAGFSLAPPPGSSPQTQRLGGLSSGFNQPTSSIPWGGGVSGGGWANNSGSSMGIGMAGTGASMNSMRSSSGMSGMASMAQQQSQKPQQPQQPQQPQRSGLDKYESLL